MARWPVTHNISICYVVIVFMIIGNKKEEQNDLHRDGKKGSSACIQGT